MLTHLFLLLKPPLFWAESYFFWLKHNSRWLNIFLACIVPQNFWLKPPFSNGFQTLLTSRVPRNRALISGLLSNLSTHQAISWVSGDGTRWYPLAKLANETKFTSWLVVSIPLKNMKVTWDDEIPNMWKNKIHVPNHQPARVWRLTVRNMQQNAKLPTWI